MNFLSEEQEMWWRTVSRFMDEEITREYVRKCDMERQFPYEGFDKIAAQGWLKALIPEEAGGDGGNIFDFALMCEALAKYGFDFAASLLVSTFTALNVVHHASPEQVERLVKPFMAGKLRFAILISEPGVGSDVSGVKLRARLDGNEYVLNGQKLWASGSGAENTVLCVLARTDPDAGRHGGLSIFLVPNDTPGVDIQPIETVVRRMTGTYQVYFDDARVAPDTRLGEPGQGWQLIIDHLDIERVSISAAYVGNAQQAVDDALAYAQEREQFGRAIYEFQVIRHRLADMQTRVDAARLMVYRAADMASRGEPCTKEVAMAKLFASETLRDVSLQGLQIMGGHGQLPEADMERYVREGTQATIGGGTSEIQRTIIAKHMRHS